MTAVGGEIGLANPVTHGTTGGVPSRTVGTGMSELGARGSTGGRTAGRQLRVTRGS